MKYNVNGLTVDESATIIWSLKDKLCECWKWRSDHYWRQQIREIVTTIRKVRTAEAVL